MFYAARREKRRQLAEERPAAVEVVANAIKTAGGAADASAE